jgi:hypothetical protein
MVADIRCITLNVCVPSYVCQNIMSCYFLICEHLSPLSFVFSNMSPPMLMYGHTFYLYTYFIVYKIAEYQVKEEQINIQKKRQENMDSRGGEVTY